MLPATCCSSVQRSSRCWSGKPQHAGEARCCSPRPFHAARVLLAHAVRGKCQAAAQHSAQHGSLAGSYCSQQHTLLSGSTTACPPDAAIMLAD